MELLEYIKKNYKTPNVAVLKTLGASEELIKYLTNTPWNTNMKIVEGLINKGDEGNGIKSITITPAIETTPALDSLFPMYLDENIPVEDWPDVRNVNIATSTTLQVGDEYTVTVTPTEGSIVSVGNVYGTEPGASVSRTETVTTEDDFKFFSSLIQVKQGAETCMNVTFVVHQE